MNRGARLKHHLKTLFIDPRCRRVYRLATILPAGVIISPPIAF